MLHSLIRHHFPNGCIHLTPIATGKFNDSYWVQVDNEQMVLRIAPPNDAVYVFYEAQMMKQEPQLHQILREQTTVPVAEILVFDESQTLIDRDYMLMERLAGRPLTEAPHVNFDNVLGQIGTYLAQVHGLTADQHGYLGAHKPMEPQDSWAAAFIIMWHKMIDDIVSLGYYDQAESSHLRHLLDRHLPLFDRPLTARLLHMDIWHQNILVDDQGTVTGLVDWDRALWGDPEIEFAVLDYCGISNPAFWQGYGQPRDWSPEAQVRQVFYLLYELQKYIVIRDGRSHDPAAARQVKQQVWQIMQQL
ncbi:MAG: aminoglycoside phosphotransferase family protein [Ardenticatenaceae bacterium]|nr:aminoglycoside phosphotransferase family protein [Ardenticatenaceae bacterium]